MKDWDLDLVLSYHKEINRRWMARAFPALLTSEGYLLTPGIISLLEAVDVTAACSASCAVNMKSHSSPLRAF